jgi:hypothetical protein
MGTAALAALAATGCPEDPDPLDPEVLTELARSRGDAQGIEHTGVYQGTFEVLECGCSELDVPFNPSLCASIEAAEAIGLPRVAELELVQADGTVRLRALGLGDFFEEQASLLPVFYGPLQADGRFSAAGVLEADALAVQGRVLGRIDGVIEPSDEVWSLVGEYQQRYAVDLFASPDVLDVGIDDSTSVQSVDCRERIAVDLRWVSPPPVALGGPGRPPFGPG